MLNWIKRTMLTSTCAAYNGGKPQPISNHNINKYGTNKHTIRFPGIY